MSSPLPSAAAPEPSAGPRRSRRTEARRAQILDAAAEVFADLGYGAATLEAIGDRVGLSKASLYYYVKGKEDLLAQIMLAGLATVAERYEAATAGAGLDPAGRLRALARSHAYVVCNTPGGRLIGRHGELRERATTFAKTGGRYRKVITDLVAEGVAAGQFRPVDDEVFGWTFMLALNNIAAFWAPGHPRTPEDIAEDIAGYFINGLRP